MSNQATVDHERFSTLRNKILDRSDLDKIDSLKVLESIKKWSGSSPDHLDLFEIIVDLFDNDKSSWETGRESDQIDNIVRINIIEDWRNNKASDHLSEIEQKILGSTESIRIYRRLLNKDSIPYNSASEPHQILLDSGLIRLISQNNNKLTIANDIYRTVFDIQWVNQHSNTPIVSTTQNKNRVSNMSWMLSFLSLPLMVIVIILIPQETPGDKPVPSPSPSTSPSPSVIDKDCKNNLQEIESNIDRIILDSQSNDVPQYFGDQIYWQEQGDLDEECQLKVEDKLFTQSIRAAAKAQPEQAVEFLCLIRDRKEKSSEFFELAQKQLSKWYDPKDPSNLRPTVEESIQSLSLERPLPDACPAAPPELLGEQLN